MYSIKYKKNKEGKNIGIDSLIIDAVDLEMMKYSSDINLIKLYGLNYTRGYDALILCCSKNKNEIISILRNGWLINRDTLTEELALLKLEYIYNILQGLSKIQTSDSIEAMYTSFNIKLYEYVESTLKKYLKSNYKRKKGVRNGRIHR